MDRQGVDPAGLPAVPGTAEISTELRDYPVQAGILRQDEYHRWLPLVKWLLAIPHYFCLFFLGLGAFFVWLAAVFAVLFTGSYPRGMWDYMVGVQRWAFRVNAYHYLMVDPYPPFTLEDVPDYPARLAIPYPEGGVERWRPFVAWLLIFPYAVVAAVLVWVAGIMALIGFFSILFTRRWPDGLFEVAEVAFRWILRANAYAYFLVTRYPPFAWG